MEQVDGMREKEGEEAEKEVGGLFLFFAALSSVSVSSVCMYVWMDDESVDRIKKECKRKNI
jgi:hypothetical protein